MDTRTQTATPTRTRRRLAKGLTAVGAAVLVVLGTAGESWASTPTSSWTTGAPGPVSRLTLPMAFRSAPAAGGLYFSYYTTLESGTRPYAGFQPKEVDSAGRPTLQAVFSSFNADATTTDGNCSYGADGGAGVSCAVRFPYEKGTMYALVLKRASVSGATQQMTGDVVNASTGAEVAHIGGFGLPSSSGRFKNADGGFIEPYLSAGCSQRATVTYGKPIGTEAGEEYTGGLPTVTDPASGSCLSSTSSTTAQGRQVTVTGDAATGAARR
ncbi:hypothetical protein [Streptomyces tsukubensis]|uniref:Uncharacterized protein n=1 Tax=Streptomyces tsukubensis TaxID=83656 RepID=A0A1V4AFT6_9ACTN|nr:hypothetical protein [Streptomyces tsukubensis]OON82894.1 hypothetical protein B1H18_02455 [Streptomyces tsukubensis]QFR91922.1 hypothetical protein GBW32_01225 [Streptomyces tsukubensis]